MHGPTHIPYPPGHDLDHIILIGRGKLPLGFCDNLLHDRLDLLTGETQIVLRPLEHQQKVVLWLHLVHVEGGFPQRLALVWPLAKRAAFRNCDGGDLSCQGIHIAAESVSRALVQARGSHRRDHERVRQRRRQP